PATIRKVVDLPQPLGPTSTRNSRSRISRLASWTATTLPNRFVTRSRVTPANAPPSLNGRSLHSQADPAYYLGNIRSEPGFSLYSRKFLFWACLGDHGRLTRIVQKRTGGPERVTPSPNRPLLSLVTCTPAGG